MLELPLLYVKVEWPAIVTEAEWRAANVAAEKRRPPKGLKNLLSTLIRCQCGKAAVAQYKGWNKDGTRQFQYGCPGHGSLVGWAVEAVVMEATRRHLADREALRRGHEAILAHLSNGTAAATQADLAGRRAEIAQGRARLIAAVEEGVFSPPEVRKRLDELERQDATLEGQIHDLEEIRKTAPKFLELVALADGFPYATQADNRDVLRAFIRALEIDFGTRTVTLRWKLDSQAVVLRLPGMKGRVSRFWSLIQSEE